MRCLPVLLAALIPGLLVLPQAPGSLCHVADDAGQETRTANPKEADMLVLDLGAGVKLELIHIKAGSFLMASATTDREGYADEKPQHEATIRKDFFLGKYPVTQEQYEQVMGANPSWFSKDGRGSDKVNGIDTRRFPVESVSWSDAQDFCTKASKQTKKRLRLPTEAEWEYACRAGSRTQYYCGDKLTAGDANFGRPLQGWPTKVGTYPPNRWGLHDMAGNVWQWCADGRRHYVAGRSTDPVGPTDEDSRILRGGSWHYFVEYARSASRFQLEATRHPCDVGFRVLVRLD
jgi:formylglycine-generating enzyme required for sulfatase activity